MADLIPIGDSFPEGFNDKEQPQSLKSGELSKLLTKGFGDRLRWNELTWKPEIDGKPVDEMEFQLLHVRLSEMGWTIGKELAQDAFTYAAMRNRYHPIKEYLDRIKNDPKVLVGQIDQIATNYLGVDDLLSNAIMRITLIGAVERVLNPGCKFHTCVVLKGEQGIGKSSFWQILGGEWFCDTPQEKLNDLKMLFQTCWIYEFAELETIMGRKESGDLKNLLSSQEDRFRPPYFRSLVDSKRPGIVVGTVNLDAFLKDETGSRRFLVIKLPNPAGVLLDLAKLKRDRDQLWKAALVALDQGVEPYLSQEEQALSNNRNTNFEEENIWLDPLSKWLYRAPQKFTTADALVDGLNFFQNQIRKPDERKAAQALKQLGCVQDKDQTRVSGSRVRFWHKPLDVLDSDDSDVRFLSEADLNPAGRPDVEGVSHYSYKNKKKEELINTPRHAPLLGKGKTSESSETSSKPPVGSGWDVSQQSDLI